MSVSPCFQLWVNDFLGSAKVGMMNGSEVGVYFMLLLLDWQETGIEYDPPMLARWCRVDTPTFESAWPLVGRCFNEREGRLFNPRLEVERAKQVEWRRKSHDGGIASGEARRKVTTTTLEPPFKHPSAPILLRPLWIPPRRDFSRHAACFWRSRSRRGLNHRSPRCSKHR